jgi:hypothetical protein
MEDLVSSIAGEVERQIRNRPGTESEDEDEDEEDEVLSEDNVE